MDYSLALGFMQKAPKLEQLLDTSYLQRLDAAPKGAR